MEQYMRCLECGEEFQINSKPSVMLNCSMDEDGGGNYYPVPVCPHCASDDVEEVE